MKCRFEWEEDRQLTNNYKTVYMVISSKTKLKKRKTISHLSEKASLTG